MEHCGRLWKRAPLRSRLQLNLMLKFSKNVHTFQFYSAHDSIISICKSELCDILRSYVVFFLLSCLFLSVSLRLGMLALQVSREEFPIKVFADQPGPEAQHTARIEADRSDKCDISCCLRILFRCFRFRMQFVFISIFICISWYILIYLKLAVLSWITLDVGRWVAKDALLHASLHVLGSLRPWHCGRCLVSPGAEKGGARGDAGAGEQGTLPSLWKTPHIHFGIFWYFGILIQSYTLYDFHLLSL